MHVEESGSSFWHSYLWYINFQEWDRASSQVRCLPTALVELSHLQVSCLILKDQRSILAFMYPFFITIFEYIFYRFISIDHWSLIALSLQIHLSRFSLHSSVFVQSNIRHFTRLHSAQDDCWDSIHHSEEKLLGYDLWSLKSISKTQIWEEK